VVQLAGPPFTLGEREREELGEMDKKRTAVTWKRCALARSRRRRPQAAGSACGGRPKRRRRWWGSLRALPPQIDGRGLAWCCCWLLRVREREEGE
jgi:hypothetical protein